MSESSTYDEILEVATNAAPGAGAPMPLEELGWGDIVADLDDPDAFAAALAVLRAQGRSLSSSRALGSLAAQPYAAAGGFGADEVVATIARDRGAARRVDVLIGDPAGRRILVDGPDGATLTPTDDLELTPLPLPGHLTAHRVRFCEPKPTHIVGFGSQNQARGRSLVLQRLGAASEMLGAAETVLAMAVEYAGDREQFGRPIGTFQAVRHLLAWAKTDGVALDAVVREALRLGASAPANLDVVVKALAGRNGRRICQRALQAFGGIGFTAEHDHHHFHGRVLFLDGLAGTSSDLTHELGAWLRTTGTDPAFAGAALDAAAAGS